MLLLCVIFSPPVRLQEFGHSEEITDLCSNEDYKLIVNKKIINEKLRISERKERNKTTSCY